MGLMNFIVFWFQKYLVTSFSWNLLCSKITAEINKTKKRTQHGLPFTFNALSKYANILVHKYFLHEM